MKTKELLKTDCKMAREEKELAIYKEYQRLIAVRGAMKSAVDTFLMKKYGIFAKSTIWAIRQRVERRMKCNGNG